MNLTGIIAISGRAGLYKVIAQGKNNLIVESLEDKKRFPAYASDRISALEDISIYTYEEDLPLKVIYDSIYSKENGGMCISHKLSQTELVNYLLEVLPNYDQERVYISDIKKLFQWYNLLHKAGELKLDETESSETATEEVSAENEVATEEKPKKAAPKKAAAPKKTADKPKAEKAPAKKATAGKKVAAPKSGTSRGK